MTPIYAEALFISAWYSLLLLGYLMVVATRRIVLIPRTFPQLFPVPFFLLSATLFFESFSLFGLRFPSNFSSTVDSALRVFPRFVVFPSRSPFDSGDAEDPNWRCYVDVSNDRESKLDNKSWLGFDNASTLHHPLLILFLLVLWDWPILSQSFFDLIFRMSW